MLTPEQKQQIITDAEKAREAKQLSCNAASTQIGISNATYSNMLNGSTQPGHDKWKSINDERWLMVKKWATPHASTAPASITQTNSPEWPLMDTINLRVVIDLCTDAQANSRLLSVCADTGLGKTTGLKKYCADTPNAYYTLCTVTMGRKDFLNAIARSMGMDVEGSIHSRLATIVNKLAGLDRPLLVLDDVGKLNDACLRLLQIVYDELERRIGIVIAGLPYFQKTLFRNAVKGKQGFPELRRRIGYWQPLQRPTAKFIQSVCQRYSITELPAINYLTNTIADMGTLREVIENYYRTTPTDTLTQLEILTRLHVGTKEMEAA